MNGSLTISTANSVSEIIPKQLIWGLLLHAADIVKKDIDNNSTAAYKDIVINSDTPVM
jgi:hypothetical protein